MITGASIPLSFLAGAQRGAAPTPVQPVPTGATASAAVGAVTGPAPVRRRVPGLDEPRPVATARESAKGQAWHRDAFEGELDARQRGPLTLLMARRVAARRSYRRQRDVLLTPRRSDG